MPNKARFSVKIDLTKEEYDKINEIKKHYGLRYDTEALRIAINDSHRIMLEREKMLSAISKQKIKE